MCVLNGWSEGKKDPWSFRSALKIWYLVASCFIWFYESAFLTLLIHSMDAANVLRYLLRAILHQLISCVAHSSIDFQKCDLMSVKTSNPTRSTALPTSSAKARLRLDIFRTEETLCKSLPPFSSATKASWLIPRHGAYI